VQKDYFGENNKQEENMSNSRFRAIPKSEAFTIPFKLEEAALLDWLIKLAHLNGKEACLLTLNLTQALNKKNDLSFKSHISFLKLINRYLKSYIAHLDNPCWDAGFPLAMEERIYAEMITWNYLSLGQGFFIAANNASKKEDQAFALLMALHVLGQAQLHIAAVYSTPDKGFWTLLYQIFSFAEKRKLLTLHVDKDDFTSTSISALFLRTLVFQVCDTNQFRPRDMRTVYDFLDIVCLSLPISKLFSGEKDLFLFDIFSDNPPVHVTKQTELVSESARYFSPLQVAKNIVLVLKQGDLWSGTLRSINHALFRRVIKTLEQKQKRIYTRRNESRLLLGVIGFEAILGFLYTVSKKHQPLVSAIVKKETMVNSDLPKTAQSDLKRDELEDDELPSNKKFVSNYLHLAHKSLVESKIWDDNKKSLELPNKKVSLKKITVFDSSANGYSLHWNQVDAKAKVGDIFGIISDDKKRLEIAFIRRIAMSDSNDFRFGTEVVGFESEIVYLGHIDGHEQGRWAIFIPGIELLNKPDTLIYNIGSFKAGDGVYMYRSDHKKLCVLVRELHSTATISHVELTYPAAKKH